MASGWETYYVLFLSAVFALTVPIALWAISWAMKYREEQGRNLELPGSDLKVHRPPDTILGKKINTRFFLGATIALVLVTLGLFLVPYAGTLAAGKGLSMETRLRGLLGVLSIVFFSGIALLYAARKGDLDWLDSYPRRGRGGRS